MTGCPLTGGSEYLMKSNYVDVQWEFIVLVLRRGGLSNVTKYIRYSEMLGNTRHGGGKGNLELHQV